MGGGEKNTEKREAGPNTRSKKKKNEEKKESSDTNLCGGETLASRASRAGGEKNDSWKPKLGRKNAGIKVS